MIEVVDATTSTSGVTAAQIARAQEILRVHAAPKRGYFIMPATLSMVLAANLVPADQQHWWRCPCASAGAGGCPHAVLYGRVTGRARIGFTPTTCFEEPGLPLAEASANIMAFSIGTMHDLDALPDGVAACGRPGLATMLRVWFELGLRDTLIVALGRLEA